MNIYEMPLHEHIPLTSNASVMRVPGGWIYMYGNSVGTTSVFVTFHNEFQISSNAPTAQTSATTRNSVSQPAEGEKKCSGGK